MNSLSARKCVYVNVIHFHFLCMLLTLCFPLLVSMHHIPPDKVLDWYQYAFVPESNGEVLQQLNKLFTRCAECAEWRADK